MYNPLFLNKSEIPGSLVVEIWFILSGMFCTRDKNKEKHRHKIKFKYLTGENEKTFVTPHMLTPWTDLCIADPSMPQYTALFPRLIKAGH